MPRAERFFQRREAKAHQVGLQRVGSVEMSAPHPLSYSAFAARYRVGIHSSFLLLSSLKLSDRNVYEPYMRALGISGFGGERFSGLGSRGQGVRIWSSLAGVEGLIKMSAAHPLSYSAFAARYRVGI